MKIVGVLVLAFIGIVALALVLIELLLRRWAAGEGDRPSGVATSRNRHGEAGKGSWTLSPEVAKQRDPGFSSTQWSEMQAWAQRSPNFAYMPVSEANGRELLSFDGYDFVGQQLSIIDGIRTTSDQPADAQRDLFCFGGSTTFCMETRDSHTWSSCLQRCLNEEFGRRVRVTNHGVPGAPGLDRIDKFRYCTFPKPGDISVFLFGDNDAGWVQRYPSGAAHHLLIRPLKRLERESPGRILLFEWLKREFAVFLRRRLAASTAKATIKAAEDAMEWANARGASVLFVLQPNIMTLARRDAWDTQIYGATAPNLFVMLEVAYRHYRDWMKRNPNVVSATHIFDDEKPSPYMGDWAHANSRGNQLIADFVFDELTRRNLLKPERTVEVSRP
jgi:hypothetical protein